MKNKIVLLILLAISIDWGYAQTPAPDLEQVNEDRIQLSSRGMFVLGGWAVSNITVGMVGMTRSSGNLKYFHQMNTFWNTVNLGIAGFGYYGLKNQTANLSLSETLSEFQRFENILLFNAGLDVGYMALGAFLWERGLRKESSRLEGYGRSIIVQGGFLFAFDIALFALSKKRSNKLVSTLSNMQFAGNTVRLSYNF